MERQRGKQGIVFALAAVLFGIAAGAGAAQEAAPAAFVRVLASSRPGMAENTDSRLVDPWGLAAMRSGPWWIADGANGRLTAYNGTGLPVPLLNPLSVHVDAAPGAGSDYATPSAVVFNDGRGFELAPSEPSWFLIATREGQVEGWFPGSGSSGATILTDRAPEAGYTGATLAADRLYVANFRQNRIDALTADLSAIDLPDGAFTDPNTPNGLSPYNVRSLGGALVVTYAAPDVDGSYAVPGAGHVAVFDESGLLIVSLQPGPWLDAPWGAVIAPQALGALQGDLLVANTGSGRISVFDPATGAFRGYLRDPAGEVIVLPGLHDIAFGNDDTAGPGTTLYFTAGPQNGRTGIFGSLTFTSLRR